MRKARSDQRETKDEQGENFLASPRHSSPQRKCIVTGESFDKSELLRFVHAPNGVLTFDANGKLPGRGAYVSMNGEALKAALKKNLFAKSFKENMRIPSNMIQQIMQQIRQGALQYLALARRAGEAVAGAEKCKDFAMRHKIAAVILAEDAGEGARALAHHLGEEPLTPVTLFNREELGAIFGREQAVIIALRTGGLAKKFLNGVKRHNALKEVSPLP